MPTEYIEQDVTIEQQFEAEVKQLAKLIQESKMPEWWKTYSEQIAYNLQVHTKGLMFDKITTLYPNEHPDSQKHCINSYESITKGSIWKAINNITRVFNNSAYNVDVSDKTKEVIEEYEDEYGNMFSQFLEDWIKNAIATDPNGICVVYPIDYTKDLWRYICYKDIMLMSEEVLIFISEEESEKKYEFKNDVACRDLFIDYEYTKNGQPVPNYVHTNVKTYNRRLEANYSKKVYHVFTKQYFFRFYDIEENQYSYTFYKFDQELPTLPYFENGGVEIEENIYESFIQAFVPFGNLALMSHRNQRAIDLMHAYPKMSEVQQPCDDCNGRGRIECAHTVDPSGWRVCATCKGSKYVTIQSPYKVYRKVQDSFDTDGNTFKTPSVEYYTPPIEPMEFTNKQWASYLEKAETAVFVQQKVNTGNVQSAESKGIDREELYSWLSNISKVLYGNTQMFLQYVENYVNPTPVRVSVEIPYSFAILTESEAFDALNTMLTSSAPVLLKANQIDNFVNKFTSESSPVKRALYILKKFDLLLYYSNQDVASLKGQGVVSPKMVQQHALAYPVLIQLYERDKKLFDQEDDQIIVKLTAEVAKYDLTSSLQQNVLNFQT